MDKTLLLMTLDAVISLGTYFIAKYLHPAAAQDVLYVIAGLQPVVIYVIKTWKDKEVALIAQGIDPKTRQSFK